jgi:hypothetical protein
LVALNGRGPPCEIQQNGPQRIDDQLARTINPSHTPTKCENQAPPDIQLNARWRVITCADGVQWILQRRNVPAGTGGNRPERHSTDDWRGRSYCRTREALIRCCRAYSGEIDPVAAAALQALPERIEGKA